MENVGIGLKPIDDLIYPRLGSGNMNPLMHRWWRMGEPRNGVWENQERAQRHDPAVILGLLDQDCLPRYRRQTEVPVLSG